MGKALYREYRPKSLDEVVGQEHITTTLRNALKKGAVSHAYLFTGPRGVGKTSIARILAHAVNELDYSDESIHLDIIEIDAASNRRIDEIRDLREKVHIAPTSAKYKVYIIDEVHMLTREAFNALLKTLEEPPEHVIFILATTEAHKVPETIISRTQKFTFKPIGEADTINLLEKIAKNEKLKINKKALALITEYSGGSFRDSISILDQLSGFTADEITENEVKSLLGIPDDKIINSLIKAIENDNLEEIFNSIQSLIEQGIDSGKAAKNLSQALRKKLVNNDSAINETKIITILQNLLPITGTSNDYLALELAILDVFKEDKSNVTPKPVNEKKPKTTENVKNDKIKSQETKQSVIDEKETEIYEITDDNNQSKDTTSDEQTNNWAKMLEDIKGKHNTFYGLLRMAKVDDSEDPIRLIFQFDFHKKQVDSAQHATILRKYMTKHFGNHEYKTVVIKSTEKTKSSTQTPQKYDVSGDVSNISNIFGGAELLD
ncbi:DNA polymerase III subunit gamma/tau [Candidatus Saccharibacteria bacterium]|nr:DNA polymerase III subunit gamma/tau [Candidatus Saccharibacteria bacterium]